MLIEQLFEPGLGHASYLVADPDAGVAFVVDPRRDVETYLAAASRLGVLITHSFETHVHNDYLSGSRALAELRPIEVVAGALAELSYPHRALGDGETVRVGALEVHALATPGHTPEHVAWLVADLRRAEEPQYLFSGGALLVGHAARVDLLGRELEPDLARAAQATIREKVLSLPDFVAVFPTHGGGSACSGTVAGSRWTTLGFERRHNPVALAALADHASFRAALSFELPIAPAYYASVRRLNGTGAPLAPSAPLRQLGEAAVRAAGDAVLLDPRPPHLFGAGHRPGALNVVGNDGFAVRVGATVPFGSPIVLLSDDADAAERLRAQLARIGYDDVRGYATPAPDVPLASLEQVDAATAHERARGGAVLLDVREPAEWAGGHAPGAIFMPYGEVPRRMSELPAGRPVIVYCASGVRSSLAASLLVAARRDAANVRGGMTAWRRAGLPVER